MIKQYEILATVKLKKKKKKKKKKNYIYIVLQHKCPNCGIRDDNDDLYNPVECGLLRSPYRTGAYKS